MTNFVKNIFNVEFDDLFNGSDPTSKIIKQLEQWSNTGKDGAKIDKFFQNKRFLGDENLVEKVIWNFPRYYIKLPERLRSNEKIAITYLYRKDQKTDAGWYLVPESVYQNNENFVFKVIKNGGYEVLGDCPSFISEDRKVVQFALEYIRYREDNPLFNEFYFKNENGERIKVTDDKSLMMTAIKSRADSLEFIGDNLKRDKDILSTFVCSLEEHRRVNFSNISLDIKTDPIVLSYLFSIEPLRFVKTMEEVTIKLLNGHNIWIDFKEILKSKNQDFFIKTFRNTDVYVGMMTQTTDVYFDYVLEMLAEENIKLLIKEDEEHFSGTIRYLKLRERLMDIENERLKERINILSFDEKQNKIKRRLKTR